VTGAGLLLAAVTIERLGELWLADRNTRALLTKGGMEVAPRHYLLIVLLHATWLAGLWVFGATQSISMFWLIVFLLLQVLRVWVLATLGRRWTTRIIIVPHETLVVRGPYQWISHPNYLVVVGEIATLPLALGLPLYALIFSIANAAVLTIRIRAENAALSGSRHVQH
jgi:methyltransferase